MQSVFIKGRFPGLNEIIGAARTHWAKSAKDKKTHTDRVVWSVGHLHPVESADFVFTWFEIDKRRNKDNVCGGGQKYCFDGLQKAGIIKNDGWQQVKSITHKFEVGEPGVLIEIMEAQG
ncbi:MAG: hypothetical protein A2Y66_01915 [Nitrospirae bacterium RBG_13_41_22]|nr:MAG: hypothetical protein A2Y66_01915 [Nitrospirae bacterium RBG_13_41_22]